MNRLGEGVPQNDKVAIKWYTLATAHGIADAQNNIGIMYYDGTGVPQNYELAVKQYNLSAYNNHQLGVTYKAEMAELMAYAEITKAQNMSSHCLRNNYMRC